MCTFRHYDADFLYIINTNMMHTTQMNKCVACCLTLRNCGKYLDEIFSNLDLLSTLFTNFNVICVYDNCSDDTEHLLLKYHKRSRYRVCLFNNVNNNHPFRTVRIANSRNMCLKIMKSRLNTEYHFVIDADDVNVLKWDMYLIIYYLNTDDCLSFNRSHYYDIWALSYNDHKHHCWGFNSGHIIVDHMARDIVAKLHKLKDYELFECFSAFNGFAIYRTNKFDNVMYDGTYTMFKSLFSNEEREILLNKLKMELNDDTISFNDYEECCEHLFYHISSITKNNARIRISNKIL